MAVTERPLFIRLNLPDGLEEALEGLAREVLREKPGNIYEFAADYFEDLVKKRNKGAYWVMSIIRLDGRNRVNVLLNQC